MDRDCDTDPRIRSRQLFEHENVRKEVGARPAVFIGHADTKQSELGERAEQLARKAVLAVPVGSMRLDPLRGEVSCKRLDLTLLGVELEVHLGSPQLPGAGQTSANTAAARASGPSSSDHERDISPASCASSSRSLFCSASPSPSPAPAAARPHPRPRASSAPGARSSTRA